MYKKIRKLVIMAGCVLLLGMTACNKTEDPAEAPLPTNVAEEQITQIPEATPEPTVSEEAKPTATPKPTNTPTPTPTPFPTPLPELVATSIKAEAEKFGFSFGTVIDGFSVGNAGYKTMVENEFNSITAANEMKAYSLLDQKASQSNPDGMPVMNYSMADKIVGYAEEIGIGVRGHVLVWDAYMCDWFFREGYANDGAYVDAKTIQARVKYYIEEVITHFETEFPGVVYCWDVVNEAVGDNEGEYAAGDARHLRTVRSGGDNIFYKIMGEDYVALSFLYAKDTVEKLQAANPEVSITLFYNDYNTFYEDKRDAVIELVKSINTFAKDENGEYRVLCEGVGMQGYIGGYGKQGGCMNKLDINKVKAAAKMFYDLGLKVHITEMAIRNYEAKREAQHADFYGTMFQMFSELNSKEPVISNISIWGICDNPSMSENDYSYKMNSPYCGLFTKEYERKFAYYEAIEKILKVQEVAKLESEDVPSKYTSLNTANGGEVIAIEYTTRDYAGDGHEITKPAFVYLPPKYDETKQYNVLYLMHGVGGNEREWGMTGNGSQVKKMMDNLIAYGDIEPFIVVTPNGRSCADFANTGAKYDGFYLFAQELKNDLIPYIDANFATYAEYDENGYDLTAARDHRAMAGLSMGGMQTINVGIGECLDVLSWYGSFSSAPTSNAASVTAQKLAAYPEEYDIHYFYNICGVSDGVAIAAHRNATKGLCDMTDRLTDGENFLWHEVAGVHDFHVWYLGYFNFAQIVFDKQYMGE